jgi:hypothetical protein
MEESDVHLQMLGLRIRFVALRTLVASPLASQCHNECTIRQLLARNTLDLGGRVCCGGQGSLPEGKGRADRGTSLLRHTIFVRGLMFKLDFGKQHDSNM